MMLKNITRVFIYLTLLVSLFYPYKDFDWGWHYKYGEYFAQTGSILKQDIFSTTLPGYKLSNHSWTYDIFIYYVYQLAGFKGLFLVGPPVFLLIFYLCVKNYNLSNWQLALGAFFYTKFTHITYLQGIRTQILGLLMQVILLIFLQKGLDSPKKYYWLPLLFWLWVNIHASFVVGLLITIIYLAVILGDYLMQKSNFGLNRLISLGTAFVGSILVTFVNPFGLGVYSEALRHVNNPWLSMVIEWKPFNRMCLDCEVSWVFLYFALITLLVIRRFRWRLVPLITITAILFMMGLSHLRYMVMSAVSGLILVSVILSNTKLMGDKKTLNVLIITLAIVVLSFSKFTFEKPNLLPSPLVSILKTNPPEGNGFNNYDYGGVLLGLNLVPKVFVYGHMHMWDKNGYSPFADSLGIDLGYEQIFDKYKFNWVITRSDSPLLKKLSALDGWRKLYSDLEISYLVRTHLEATGAGQPPKR